MKSTLICPKWQKGILANNIVYIEDLLSYLFLKALLIYKLIVYQRIDYVFQFIIIRLITVVTHSKF